jgi:hypothetical protein
MNDAIRKIVIPVAAIAAVGYGGAQFAGASGNQPTAAKHATTTTGDGDGEHADDGTMGDHDGDGPGDHDGDHDGHAADEQVPAAAAVKARAAAIKAVPGGTVVDIHAERADDAANDAAEKADAADNSDATEKTDAADPAYESKIAYDVDVTKSGGATVTVHLDRAFDVLGITKDEADAADDRSDNADAADNPSDTPDASDGANGTS